MSTQQFKDISLFTRILWWIAGASPEILVNYPSEYSKFTAIGMTISMTCLVAFVSGMAAAWYFSSSIWASILFGIFWALLIFCIDRALVVTMKKTTAKQDWLEYLKILIPRAVLAILVALLMSIPLELIVFEDLINAELPNYENEKMRQASMVGYYAILKNEAEEKGQQLQVNYNQAQHNEQRVKENLESLKLSVKEIENQIQSKRNQIGIPNTDRYKSAEHLRRTLQVSLNNMASDNPKRNEIRSKIKSQQNVIESEKKIWKEKISQEINQLEVQLQDARNKQQSAEEEFTQATQVTSALNKAVGQNAVIDMETTSKINNITGKIDSALNSSNKFILHYSVLDYAVYAKIQEKIPIESLKSNKNDDKKEKNEVGSIIQEYETIERYRNPDALTMLWLIRLLFFIFEMMPTVVKAVAKPGAYEAECEAQEKSATDHLTSSAYKDHMMSMLNDQLSHERQLADERHKAEKDLHDRILHEIRVTQQEVALAAIEKWRREQLQRAHSSKALHNDSQQNISSGQTVIMGVNDAVQKNIVGDEFD